VLRGKEVLHLLILNFGTRWGWVVSVTPQPGFSPWERTTGTHCTGGWVDPRTGLTQRTEEKSFRLCRVSKRLQRNSVSQSRRRLTCYSNLDFVPSLHSEYNLMHNGEVDSVLHSTCLSVVSSELMLLLRGGIAQGVPRTANMTDLFRIPIWVLVIPYLSTSAIWQ
jgi:hypothetical protein